MPCSGEPLLEPQGDPFLSAEELLQEVISQCHQVHQLKILRTFCQEKPKTSQQKEALIQEGKNINENKDNQDSEKEDLNEEVTEKVIDGVGEAAPLVAVSQEDEVKMLSLLVRPVDI